MKMTSSKMKEFLKLKIEECLKVEHNYKKNSASIFLYNTYTSSIDFWDNSEKDVYTEKNILQRYKRLIAASMSHCGYRNGLREVAQHLEEKYQGIWLVTYNKEQGIIKVRDYVNYGIKMFMNDSVIGFFKDIGGSSSFISSLNNFLQQVNLYDKELQEMFFVHIASTHSGEILDILDTNGINYLSPGLGSLLIKTEDDYNLLKLTSNRKALDFSMKISDMREQFFGNLFLGMDEKVKNILINRYQNAELDI